jgi:hypothetical protein
MTLLHPTPGELATQRHDLIDEADPDWQDGLHALAARCSQCGQPVTTWHRIRRAVNPRTRKET